METKPVTYTVSNNSVGFGRTVIEPPANAPIPFTGDETAPIVLTKAINLDSQLVNSFILSSNAPNASSESPRLE
jgi:hypothetical protein